MILALRIVVFSAFLTTAILPPLAGNAATSDHNHKLSLRFHKKDAGGSCRASGNPGCVQTCALNVAACCYLAQDYSSHCYCSSGAC